jgi:hypothetical protein
VEFLNQYFSENFDDIIENVVLTAVCVNVLFE